MASSSSDESDDFYFLITAGLLYNRMKKKKKRRYWIHPIVSDRRNKGCFYTLYNEINEDPEKFFNFTRMSKASFQELLSIIKEPCSRKNTIMRESIPAEEKLLITLRYLATGCSFVDLHYAFRIGKSTVSLIIQEVCKTIWTHARQISFPTPSTEKWLEIAEEFNKNADFPHCIGAIDGKHIRMIRPSNSGSMFYNYKNYFSMVLFAMCDSNYLFTFIDVGSYGKSSDSGIFKNSILYEKMVNGTLKIPKATLIEGDAATEYPFVIIGDEAFPLSENLLRPYGGSNLSFEKTIFNYRLSRARRYIECTFGILANKWRIFHRPLNVNIDLAQDIIKACCVLHNFVRLRNVRRDDDIAPAKNLENLRVDSLSRGNPRALDCRDKFANYFVNINPLEWQNTQI